MQLRSDNAIGVRTGRWRVWLLVAICVAEAAHLVWEHLHGGIVSHHLLARRDLPAIWNGWGLVLLPALAWFASGRVSRRIAASRDPGRTVVHVAIGAAAGLLTGALLSAAFVQGREDLAGAVLVSAVALGVLLPAFRVECVSGFVVAMTFVFGAVLPLLIGSVVAAVSALAHRGVYPLLWRLWKRTRHPGLGRMRS